MHSSYESIYYFHFIYKKTYFFIESSFLKEYDCSFFINKEKIAFRKMCLHTNIKRKLSLFNQQRYLSLLNFKKQLEKVFQTQLNEERKVFIQKIKHSVSNAFLCLKTILNTFLRYEKEVFLIQKKHNNLLVSATMLLSH